MEIGKGYSIQKDENSIHVFAFDQCFSEQDKKDLWTEHNILYLGGAMALWVEERVNYNHPLIHLMGEDDGQLFWSKYRDGGYADVCFDVSWIII